MQQFSKKNFSKKFFLLLAIGIFTGSLLPFVPVSSLNSFSSKRNNKLNTESYINIPSSLKSVRGMFIRPEVIYNLGPDGAIKVRDDLITLNLNQGFFLLKNIDGKPYYIGNAPVEIAKTDRDILKESINAFHEKNLKLNIYIPIYYDQTFGNKYPDELMYTITKDGIVKDKDKNKIELLSSKYKNYLKLMLEEIVKNYDVDGIYFDYIRYPNASYSLSPSMLLLAKERGINVQKIKDLLYKTFVSPADWKTILIEYENRDPDTVKWFSLREEIVKNFAEDLFNFIKSKNSKIKIGAFLVARGAYDALIKDGAEINETITYQITHFAQRFENFTFLDSVSVMTYIENHKKPPEWVFEILSKTRFKIKETELIASLQTNPVSSKDLYKTIEEASKVAEGYSIFRHGISQIAGFVFKPAFIKEDEVEVLFKFSKASEINTSCDRIIIDFKDSIFTALEIQSGTISPYAKIENNPALKIFIDKKGMSDGDLKLKLKIKNLEEFIIKNSITSDDFPVAFNLDSFKEAWVNIFTLQNGVYKELNSIVKPVDFLIYGPLYMKIGSNAFYIEGKESKMDTAPFIKDSRTFVPVRFIAEAFNFNVSWDNEKREVLIDSKNFGLTKKIILKIDSRVIKIIEDDKETFLTLDSAPFIKDSRTFIPLRFVLEGMGFKVIWDGFKKSVTIFGLFLY